MSRLKFIDGISISFITIIVVLTLTPLFLMVYTSLKPAGTLTKKPTELVLADFNNGLSINAVGGTTSLKINGLSKCKMSQVIKDQTVPNDLALKLEYSVVNNKSIYWRTWIGQDARKFSSLEFIVKNVGGDTSNIYVHLEDMQGRRTSVILSKYLKEKISGWQKVTIPIKGFDIKVLNRNLPEKLIEYLVFEIRTNTGQFFLDDVKFNLKRFTLSNYVDVLTSANFARYFINSSFIAFMVTIGNILLCALIGYAFARKSFPFKRSLFFLILAGIMLPPQVLIVPIFILMKNIGWLNTYKALIIPALVQPFNVFLMRQYISELPTSLEDVARVDGATDMQIFFKIILPLSKPALAVVGINTFMGSWNTFLFPFILTNTPHMRTLPVGLALFKSLQGADWVHLMAGSSITALPIMIIFLAFQRYIIKGLTSGAVTRQ